jgi:hypothetical protein
MATRLVIELDEQLMARLEAAATREQRVVEGFAADALTRAIADVEWAEDEAAYVEYERTGEAIPLSAMKEWLKSLL